MTKRLEEICSRLSKTKTFADVGCDHGYCAQYMLENGLCERAYITDVSAKSLKKAETLLKEYIDAGKCIPLCTDGLQGIKEGCELVLIAGMGGEEIVHILQERIPPRFVLQPMKNAPKLRAFLIERGCRITEDCTFEDGKFYDLIVGESTGGTQYTEREIIYGRDNLLNPSAAFMKKTAEELQKVKGYLLDDSMSEGQREALLKRRLELEEIYHAFEDDL